MKDNLIDEERAKQEEAAQESLEQKIDRLGKVLELFFLIKFRYFEKATKKGYQLGNTKIHKRGDSPIFELELSETIFLVDFSTRSKWPNQIFQKISFGPPKESLPEKNLPGQN